MLYKLLGAALVKRAIGGTIKETLYLRSNISLFCYLSSMLLVLQKGYVLLTFDYGYIINLIEKASFW